MPLWCCFPTVTQRPSVYDTRCLSEVHGVNPKEPAPQDGAQVADRPKCKVEAPGCRLTAGHMCILRSWQKTHAYVVLGTSGLLVPVHGA